MPKMDGLKMIEQAKKMGADCKFVILSGYSDFEYARTGILLDVKDYLLKPINVSMLKEMLEKVSDMVREEQTTLGDNEELLTEEQHSPAVQGMINALNKSLCMPYDLEYFAQEYHMTPEYLSNLFAKETKCSFSNYKKNLRMEKAKELLLTTDMKVSEIACLVGYPDQKYFSKVFKEYTGESAKQYILGHFFEDNVIKERK